MWQLAAKTYMLPQPYYQDEYATIYHADCRDILPHLPKVDLLLTDPPYGVKYVTARRSRTDKLRRPIEGDDSVNVFAAAWPIMREKLRDDRHWYVFASPRKIAEVAIIVSPYKHILAWDKGNRGTVGDLKCGFGEAWEAIFYGMKGRRPLRGPRPRTVIRRDWSSTMDPVHPTVKPIDLLRQITQYSAHEGEIVLDPFMGSGTTLVAAKSLGLQCIGIEREEAYCEIAVKRLQDAPLLKIASQDAA